MGGFWEAVLKPSYERLLFAAVKKIPDFVIFSPYSGRDFLVFKVKKRCLSALQKEAGYFFVFYHLTGGTQ